MTSLGWLVTTVEHVISFYAGGDNFEKLDYSPSGIPVLAKGDVKPFGRMEHGGRFFSPDLALKRRCRLTQSGDLLLTTRDLTQAANFLGLVAPLPTSQQYLVNQGANVIRLNNKVDERFFVYWCNGPAYRNYIKSHFVGSTQIHLRKQDFLDAPLLLPPPVEQHAIASVLGVLDDKIDLNQRTNETLETMARAIFKSWFVDFDPLHAKATRHQATGLTAEIAALFPDRIQRGVPAGWRTGTFSELAVNKRTQVKPSEGPDDAAYIALEHMPRRSIALTEWGSVGGVVSNKFKFAAGDILFGKLRPYFHKVGVAPIDGVCSTDILVIVPRQQEFFGLVLGHAASEEMVGHADAGSTGTKMPRTSWSDLGRYEIVIPPITVARRFNEIVAPMITRIRSNIHESRTLAALRNTLLPKLLSGEVRLRETEQIIAHNL